MYKYLVSTEIKVLQDIWHRQHVRAVTADSGRLTATGAAHAFLSDSRVVDPHVWNATNFTTPKFTLPAI
jgi:hypothetical protein